MAFFSETGSYGRTLLLHHRPLICDSFGRPHIPNELFDYGTISGRLLGREGSGIRELMMPLWEGRGVR